jgi:hypothetical protein
LQKESVLIVGVALLLLALVADVVFERGLYMKKRVICLRDSMKSIVFCICLILSALPLFADNMYTITVRGLNNNFPLIVW